MNYDLVMGLVIGILGTGFVMTILSKCAFQSGKYVDEKLAEVLGEEKAEKLEKIIGQTISEFLLGMNDDNLTEDEKKILEESNNGR